MIRNSRPFLSIIVPTFNRLALLKETIPAALQQANETGAELIVVDDSSTDETRAWLLGLCPQLRCLGTETNGGPGPARNLGIASARAGFFLPLDSDCLLMDGALRTIASVLEEHAAQFSAFF